MKTTLSLLTVASFVALSASLSAACSSTSQATSTGADGGPGGAVPPPPGLSCLQIIQCIVACPDSDMACPDACTDKGTPEGKANVLAFAMCVDKEKCTEATCIKEKCGPSLQTCIDSSTPPSTGTPLQGTAPPGSVPPDLVGTWAGARDGITERLIFNGDGSGSWESSIVTQQTSCFSFKKTLRTGNVVIDDATITVHATSVVQKVQECSPPTKDTQLAATTEMLKWSRADGDPNTILIIDNACAAKYPGKENCNIAGCPIGLYCTSRLKRE